VEFETSSADRVCFRQRVREWDTAWHSGIEQDSVRDLPRLKCARPHRWASLAAFPFFICLLSASQAQTVTPSSPKKELPAITTALQAHGLSNKEAKRALPVHLRGVITYFDPDYGTGFAAIFIHDESGSVYVKQTARQAANLFVGALVDVRGVTTPADFGPIVGNPQIRILGRAPLPPSPSRVSLAVLKTGVEDAQWVEVEGTVHRVIEYPHMVVLRLEMADGLLPVIMIRTPGATYSNLVDAQVRIRGNAAPTMNSDGQMIGVHLQAPDLSTVQVLESASSDPYAGSVIPIDGLLQWEHYATSMHRVHLRGAVTLQWPGSSLCIRDATRGICAQTVQRTPVTVGTLVDVAGFVEINNNAPVITDAVFRSAGENLPVPPKPVTAREILDGGFASELVQIDGLLIGYDLASSDAILQISSGDAVFPAILPKSLAGTKGDAWKVGSKLRLTGVCSVHVIDVETNVRAGIAVNESFRVLLRSPADVTVLEAPSWWTPTHALVLLGLAFTVTLCILGWVVLLRRRIELQANQLRESEQRFRHLAQHDTLTGLASRLVLEDRMKVAIESARRHQNGLALLMVDLDRFKEINDTYGHQAGDEVLCVTADRLLEAVRASDTVVRLGGDEFVVLLPEIRDCLAAELVAETVVSSLSLPVRFAGIEMPVSVSVGIGTAFAGEMDSDELLRRADAALYLAKDRGRHCFQIFTAELDEGLQEKERE
jgi:diguanylate cyclase (GGDEF)-like protein